MPFFGNKFTLKKAPLRKSPSLSSVHRELDPVRNQSEFGLNYGQVKLKLGDQETTFENGQWLLEKGGSPSPLKEIARLKMENQELIEKNNLLQLKVEILLDLLTEMTAEVHLQEAEIEELKVAVSRKQ